jgi:hypothetical protein
MTWQGVELLDWQRPRVESVPPAASSSTGKEALELCRLAGLSLDPWQEYVLLQSLGERADGKWSAFEVGVVVPRQNGKTELLVARQLVGLFLLNEGLIIHTAHLFDTAGECFRRLENVVDNTPELRCRVKLNRGRVGIRSHGNEGIELLNGNRIRYKARKGGGGRGFSCDCLFFDEAMILDQATVADILPTLSAMPNPQVWYAGSAVDQQVHQDGFVFANVRERGHARDGSLAYFEWSIPGDDPAKVPTEDLDDRTGWAQANPGMYAGRITVEKITREKPAMGPRQFAVERLGVGDWPSTALGADRPIRLEDWAVLSDPGAKAEGPIFLAVDVTPLRSASCIAAASRLADGLVLVGVVEHRPGTHWVLETLQELLRARNVVGLAYDASSPAASLAPQLDTLTTQVYPINGREHGQACGLLCDAVTDQSLRHRGEVDLINALDGADKRPLEDAWKWSRTKSSVDISPLVAATLAHWGIRVHPNSAPQVWDLNAVWADLRAKQLAQQAS